MNKLATNSWIEANQRYLKAALAVVRAAVECHIVPVGGESAAEAQRIGDAEERRSEAQHALREAASTMPKPSTVETLCSAFGLSPFERDILLLCAGMEFDSAFISLCAAAQGDATKTYPTFSLALAALPQPHWEALVPDAPLRYWRLIDVGTGGMLTLNPLRIDERILHYLTGIQHLDERLVGLVQPLRDTSDLVPSHAALAERVAYVWRQAASSAVLSIVQLCGDESASKLTIAAAACNASGLGLYRMTASAIPTSPVELDAFQRLWERESVLSGCVLLIECDELDTTDAAHGNAIAQLLENMRSPLVISDRERRRILQRPAITFDVRKPTLQEQRAAWQQELGKAAQHLNGRLDGLVSQFSLSTSTIVSTSIEVLGHVTSDEDAAAIDEMSSVLWDTCRLQARPRLEGLAQRIDPIATWEDLVLPDAQRSILREIAAHVRQRNRVYEAWGFARKSSRGLGISALFAGMSGTGKTLAAEVLAHALRLDLYHIDLSSIVSKYIGETEKNLRRVFDAAEEGGAILLFDEADALFGKRSEVKDSHDRYANIEVSYLLQRMEAYRGLAVLTTNMKNALDAAFLRRIRFIVQFPFPDAAQRAEIWRRIFPPATPTEGLDAGKLARLNVTGGNIRNIALNAAFLAADAGEPVRMKHLAQAARGEYAKLEKPLTESEIGGWV